MSLATVRRRLARLEATAPADRAAVTLGLIRQDPARTMALAGLPPDPWQAAFLRCSAGAGRRSLLLCCRQAGKSTAAAALALWTALCVPRSLVLLLSPTLRQSGELFRDKLLSLYRGLGRPLRASRETQLELTLANGSRVLSLPESEAGIRGFSGVRLLVIDEAARVDDGLYRAARPMLAVSGGSLLALSTPFGQRGWYFDAWEGRGPDGERTRTRWRRVKVTADLCPRLDPAFLAEERLELGERWYEQEYYCVFNDLIGAVFSRAAIERAMDCGLPPLFPELA